VTRALPLCQGSRFCRSPAAPSTVIYPSPASALMKTMAVAAAEAADAPEDAVSVVEVTIVVPSFEACVLIASRGAIRYGKSAVPDPQP